MLIVFQFRFDQNGSWHTAGMFLVLSKSTTDKKKIILNRAHADQALFVKYTLYGCRTEYNL